MNEGDRPRVLSTYRLQLHAGFTFEDVRRVLPYLNALGVSHVYLSPIATATPGSTHGYDVIDPTQLNPELGGDEGYERLVEEQRRVGLGQVVDIVPNHMGIAPGSGNSYWEDVLRRGPDSEYAAVFDVEWDAPPRGRVILPILGAELDEVIADGQIEVDRSGEGALLVYGNRLPLRPGSLEAWEESEGLAALAAQQYYRLEYWRAGKERLDYRRFFAIDDLIGIRTDDPAVFDLVHRLPLDLVRRGVVDGLRVDHIDGIRDPEAYLAHLREQLTEAERPDAYLVVEKILEADEPLPDWSCEGTTGYEAMNEFTRVLLSPEHLDRFDALDRRVSQREETYEEIATEGRTHVVRELLGGQFARLTRRLYEALQPPDVTPEAFEEAVLALLAHLEPYRTYHRPESLDPGARSVVEHAAARAGEGGAALDAARETLASPSEGSVREVVLSLQQIMPAIQAKGIEDRTLFRFRRLMGLNEVGGDPDTFGESVETFHERMRDASDAWPRRMLTTATHDHKLGEDVRARLAALAEMPEVWERTVEDALAAFERLQGARPDARRVHPADQYLLLQMLVGALPEGMLQGRESDDDFAGRVVEYMRKALREAAERTDWIGGDEAYEEAVADLARDAVGDAALREALRPLLATLAPAGAVNSLAQLVLKMGAPGVPDTYQGNEFWDFTLVDPDNRRAVDFELRREHLERMSAAFEEGTEGDAARAALAPQLVEAWRDGRIKLYALAQSLRIRSAYPGVFLGGSYEPVTVSGPRARNVVAFLRRSRPPEDRVALIVAPRFPVELAREPHRLWSPDWQETRLELPDDLSESSWHDAYTGGVLPRSVRSVSTILAAFPVALLVRDA